MHHATRLRWLVNLWPPNLGAGIRVLAIDPDYRHVRVRLQRYFFNRNYVGTHFGGSLFAMTDPWWMIMLIRNLGSGFVVWDKAAAIDFIKAVREPVFAEFRLDQSTIDAIRTQAEQEGKLLHWFTLDIRTGDGTVVAQVRKQVHVRRQRAGSEAITEREAPQRT